MAAWRCVDLGAVDGPTMVNLFVAVARSVGAGAAPPTLLLSHPAAPFANVGFHQEAEREVDVAYCRAEGIPIVRRVVGGGAILDGPWEQDYMLIVPQGGPGTEAGVEGFYAQSLGPVRATLASLGVPAERAGVNDLAVRGRKISANGALLLDGAWVLAGDILLDVNPSLMARVLRVPDEKFRAKLAAGMAEWLTALRHEAPRPIRRSEVTRALVAEYARGFGVALEPGALAPEEEARLESLKRERATDAWTFQKDASHPALRGHPDVGPGRVVKVADGTFLGRADVKAGKLVRATVLARSGRVEEVEISGDFFTVPFAGEIPALEAALVGAPLDAAGVGPRVRTWLSERKVRLVGIGPDELVDVVVRAGGGPAPGGPASSGAS